MSGGKWRAIADRLPGRPNPPYLLDPEAQVKVSDRLSQLGFEIVRVDVSGCVDDGQLSLKVGSALGFPDYFQGGWDGFSDCLFELFDDPPRFTVVYLHGADTFMRAHNHAFARSVWLLMDYTTRIESVHKGSAQLEFIFWGTWS